MDKLEIREWYEHEHDPSIFVMFTKDCEVVWCYSGNELRRVYLENPEGFISEPIEVAIPDYLDRKLTDFYDDF